MQYLLKFQYNLDIEKKSLQSFVSSKSCNKTILISI